MYRAHAWAVSLSLAVLLSSLDVAVFLNACKYHHTRTHTGRFSPVTRYLVYLAEFG